MSLKSKHSLLKFISQHVRCPRFYSDGVRLSKNDSKIVLAAYKLFVCVLVDVRQKCGEHTNPHTLQRLITSLESSYVKDVLTQLSNADSLLLQTTHDETVNRFSYLSVSRSDFMQSLHSLMLTSTKAWNSETSEEAFCSIHQVNCFMKRLSLQDVAELKWKAYEGWAEIEARDWDRFDHLNQDEIDILNEWFPASKTFEAYAEAQPKHGPGSTYQGISDAESKAIELRYTHEAIDLLNAVGRADLLPLEFDEMLQAMTIYDEQVIDDVPLCKVIFVPKSWKTFRTISAESVHRMYWQQFVGNAIDTWLKSGRCGLSAHYAIDTEYVNRDLAWEGSLGGQYVTLDLSSASDCHAYSLVRDGYKDTWLWPGFMLTRAPFAEVEVPNKPSVGHTSKDRSPSERANRSETRIVNQKKYAPMGNRTCFPAMTITLSCVIEAIFRRHNNGLPSSRDDYVVYGDDIVVRVEYFTEVVERLTQIGFIINVDKSFSNTEGKAFFRESCGGEYLNGYDVTPLMLSRQFCGCPSQADAVNGVYDPYVLGGLIETANRFFALPMTRGLLLFYIDRATDSQVLRDDGSAGIFSPKPTNDQLDSRGWNADYQCMQVLALSTSLRRKPTSVYDVVSKEYYTGATSWCRYDAEMVYERVKLSETLRLIQGRERLLYPEDQVQIDYDPFLEPEVAVRTVTVEV